MNTFDGERPRRDRVSVDGTDLRPTAVVVDRDGMLLFEIGHLGTWIRSSVVTDLRGNR